LKWPLVSRRRFETLKRCLTEAHLRAKHLEDVSEAWRATALDGEDRFEMLRQAEHNRHWRRMRNEGIARYRLERGLRAIGLPPEGKKRP